MFKQKTAYYMHISDWSSDVFSSDLGEFRRELAVEVVPVEPLEHVREEHIVAAAADLVRVDCRYVPAHRGNDVVLVRSGVNAARREQCGDGESAEDWSRKY